MLFGQAAVIGGPLLQRLYLVYQRGVVQPGRRFPAKERRSSDNLFDDVVAQAIKVVSPDSPLSQGATATMPVRAVSQGYEVRGQTL